MSYYVYPMNPLTCNLPVIVLGIGHEDNQPHVLRKEGYPFPQLFLCTNGEGTLKISENTFSIKRGTFFFLLPNIPHEYYGTTDKWEVDWIVFSGNQIDEILTELTFINMNIGMINNTNKVEALYKKIYITIKSEDNSARIICSSLIYEIMTELHTLQKENKNEVTEDNKSINIIKQYIDENYNQNLTIEELSALADISPQYLCRLFKKYLHLRPFQYIALKRIQRAKELLSENIMSVNDIAHSVGFSDCSYFCAVFKKYEMISPTEFRGL